MGMRMHMSSIAIIIESELRPIVIISQRNLNMVLS